MTTNAEPFHAAHVSTSSSDGAHHDRALLFLALLVAVSSHAAGASLLEWLEGVWPAAATGEASHGTIWSALGWVSLFLGSTFVFYKAFANPHSSRLPSHSRQIVRAKGLVPWIWAALAVLSLYGVATAVHRFIAFRSFDHFSWTLAIAYGLVFGGAVWLLARRRDQVLIVHTVREQPMGDWARRSHLILSLSNVRPAKHIEKDCRPSAEYVEWSDPPNLDDDLEALVRAKTSDEAEGKQIPPWPWEMPLRAIREHRGTLRQVVLLCSPDSIVQAASFRDCVWHYPPLQDLKIGVWAERDRCLAILDADKELLGRDQGVDFNDVNALSSTMTDLLHQLIAVDGVPASQIMVDFTGGKKPVSFVAAAATLRGEIVAQYMDTIHPHDPFVYDLVTNPEVRGVG